MQIGSLSGHSINAYPDPDSRDHPEVKDKNVLGLFLIAH